MIALDLYHIYVDNLSGISKLDCITWKERKKDKSVSKLTELKNNKLQYKCKECKKTSLRPIPTDELNKNFRSANKFSGRDIYKSISLQRKGVYFYEDKNSWKKFNETYYQIKKLFAVK